MKKKGIFFVKADPFPLASLKVNDADIWFFINQISHRNQGPGVHSLVSEAFARERPRNRYRVTEVRPEHVSATFFVFKALDDDGKDKTGNPRPVALKLLLFLREI